MIFTIQITSRIGSPYRKVVTENRRGQKPRRVSPLKLLAWALFAAAVIAPPADAAWQWQTTGPISSDTAAGSAGGGIVIAPAPGIQSGDTLFLMVAYDDPSALSGGWNATPSGWTLVAANDAGDNGQDRQVALFCKTAGSSEPSVTVVGAINTVVAQGVMLRYAGGTCTVHGVNTYIDQGGAVRNIATPFRQITLDNTLTIIAAGASFHGIANGVTSWPASAITRVSADTNFGSAMGILFGEKIETAAASIPSGSIVTVSANTFRSRGVLVSLATAVANPTAAPTGVAVTPTGTPSPTTTLRVTWNAATNTHHYRLRYKLASASTFTLIPTQFTSLTTDITGLVPGNSYHVQIASANASESVLLWSGSTTGITAGTPAAVKFRPGHYMAFTGITFTGNWWADFDSQLALICNNPNIKGVKFTKTWASLEKDTLGNYGATGDDTFGFGAIDRALVSLANCNKYLILDFTESQYGTPHTGVPSADNSGWLIPKYIMQNAVYGNQTGSTGAPYGIAYSAPGVAWTGSLKTVGMMWTVPVMDRIIALGQAYGARYNAHTNFIMYAPFGETSIGVPQANGYDQVAHNAQMRRALTAVSPYWPNTINRIPMNYSYDIPGLISLCVSLRNCGVGGPDPELPLPAITRTISANRCFRGLDSCTDRRGVVPWIAEQQGLGLTVRIIEPPAELSDYQRNTMRNSFMIWTRNEQWDTSQNGNPSVLSEINSSLGAVYLTTCPSNFVSCTP